jgi:serine/threonine protein phosphatase PrpC
VQDVVDFISEKFEQGLSACQVASLLLDECLANDPREARGVGCDNMTAIVVDLRQGVAVGSASSHEAPPQGGQQQQQEQQRPPQREQQQQQ